MKTGSSSGSSVGSRLDGIEKCWLPDDGSLWLCDDGPEPPCPADELCPCADEPGPEPSASAYADRWLPLSRSDADALYRQALEKAVADAEDRAAILAKAAGRGLGRVTGMTEAGTPEAPMYARSAAAQDSTPVVSGPQETTATVSVTYELR